MARNYCNNSTQKTEITITFAAKSNIIIMGKIVYRVYQLCIALPILLVLTLLTALTTIVGSFIGSAHFWGYYPGKIWSQLICRILLLPIKVNNNQLVKNESGLFGANGQAAAAAGQTQVLWKWTENSNVDMIREMTLMMTSQRALQSAAQVLKLYDGLLTKATNEVGRM